MNETKKSEGLPGGGPRPSYQIPEMREQGAPVGGEPQFSNRRLYMQLQVFTGCRDMGNLRDVMAESALASVIYADLHDPQGVGVLVMSEEPGDLVEAWRKALQSDCFSGLTLQPGLTMTGRTYSFGREPKLEDWILNKPRRNALNPAWPWAIWYPLRRKACFAVLPSEDQSRILQEHAVIGMAYGMAGIAADIRLACYGLDRSDNEFVIGLLGPELHALSKVIQDMRKTEQTSQYIESLGPFFVGKVFWQSAFRPAL